MKNTYYITSVESRLNLSPAITCRLADCNPRIKDAGMHKEWKTMKHSSVELFTKGLVELTFINSDFTEVINRPVPFTAHFLFTCTKGNDTRAVWCNSLS